VTKSSLKIKGNLTKKKETTSASMVAQLRGLKLLRQISSARFPSQGALLKNHSLSRYGGLETKQKSLGYVFV
jgi:hypothetical protein